MTMIGVIGGSGLYEIEGFIVKDLKKITTPFGSPSDSYRIGDFSGKRVIFLPRHGSEHTIPSHKVNYRANIWGFKKLGVERIISVSAVGCINPRLKPGTIVVPDQIIDMTRNRASTFYDGDQVVHIDFTDPYCSELRKYLFEASKNKGIDIEMAGVYVCVNGPRLETKAEIQFFLRIGADIVGMTAMPEAALARELGICFACITVITNYAAGITEKKLMVKEVIEIMNENAKYIKELLSGAFAIIPKEINCYCKQILKEAMI